MKPKHMYQMATSTSQVVISKFNISVNWKTTVCTDVLNMRNHRNIECRLCTCTVLALGLAGAEVESTHSCQAYHDRWVTKQ